MNHVPQQLVDELRVIDTPTLCNAIEMVTQRPFTEGFSGVDLRCLTPPQRFAGYAATLRISTAHPASTEREALSLGDVFKYLDSLPTPRIAVLYDVDEPAGRAANAGDIMTLSFRMKGCVAIVTNGAVRDIAGISAAGVACYAAGLAPSHGYFHWVSLGDPALISGLEIREGDLLVGDEHGLVRVPVDDAVRLPALCARIREREIALIDYLDRRDPVPDEYLKLQKELAVRVDQQQPEGGSSPYG